MLIKSATQIQRIQQLTMEAPSCDAMLSSTDNGMMELVMTKQPTHMITKKKGWDALTTAFCLLQYVHTPHPTAAAIATAAAAKPTGRIFDR